MGAAKATKTWRMLLHWVNPVHKKLWRWWIEQRGIYSESEWMCVIVSQCGCVCIVIVLGHESQPPPRGVPWIASSNWSEPRAALCGHELLHQERELTTLSVDEQVDDLTQRWGWPRTLKCKSMKMVSRVNILYPFPNVLAVLLFRKQHFSWVVSIQFAKHMHAGMRISSVTKSIRGNMCYPDLSG
jgi:hypothetical protein